MTSSITKLFEIAHNEKDVENAYRYAFLNQYKDFEITSPFGCDGFGVSKTNKIRVLLEFKDDLDLSNKTELAKVIAQSIYYTKKFYDQGTIPPSTVFIGDRNECLTFHVNDILPYLELDLDWSIAPSSAHRNIDLISKISDDENIRPFVFDYKDFPDCIRKVKELTDNVQRKVLVTDKNITEVFRYFYQKVIPKTHLDTNQRANLFVQLLVNKDDNYLHPSKKRKTVVTRSFGEIQISSREAFESFFSHFSSSYTPSQKHKLSAVVDRIVEDTTRRKQGEFFTPAIWVDKAHEYISSVFGEDWKEKYVVWDPAWGTGNLTRDYKFKELYCSTLIQADIDTANQMGYNPEAVKFQYDFLNDDYEKLPIGLKNAIENGKEIIVLMNPPYATSSNMNKVDDSKEGTTENLVQREMSKDKFSQAQKQLYTQFFWRLDSICSNIDIAFFSKPMFLTSEGFSDFRKKVLCKYGFGSGFLMNSNEFADTKSWGLSFSIWKKNGKENNFNFDVLVKNENLEIIKFGDKVFYNCDTQKSAGDWVRKGLKNLKKTVKPNLSSSLTVSQKNKKTSEESFGTMNNNSNQIYKSGTEVFITTSPSSLNANVDILPFNFYKVVSLFTVRKSIKMTWINEKDEYLAPNEDSLISTNFDVDSIVYSLFNNGSQQSSLRKIEYKDQLWDIKNEFFWMSKDKIKDLADENGFDNLYNDARLSQDRYVYSLLFGEERIYDRLSEDAKSVLDYATELVEKSIQARKIMVNNENHLDSWDAGYAQLKLVWKEYFPEEFKHFRQLYKNLEDRMRPLVYELGFLIK